MPTARKGQLHSPIICAFGNKQAFRELFIIIMVMTWNFPTIKGLSICLSNFLQVEYSVISVKCLKSLKSFKKYGSIYKLEGQKIKLFITCRYSFCTPFIFTWVSGIKDLFVFRTVTRHTTYMLIISIGSDYVPLDGNSHPWQYSIDL